MHFRLRFFILLSLLFTYSNADLVIGIVPQQSPLKLFRVWTPIAEYLSNEVDHKIVFKTEKSIPAFEKELYNGKYDFAYMNPYHFIVANSRQNYQAMVRADKNIQGIIVAKKGFDKTLLDSDKIKYLFPSPNAFAATLLTKHELSKNGAPKKTLDKGLYVNSHDSVYKAVSKGIGDVGGGIKRTFNNFSNKDIKNNLDIIYETNVYPSHPFAFHHRVNKDLKDKLVKALLNMPKSYLDTLNIKKIIKTDNLEYNSVKELAVELGLEIK